MSLWQFMASIEGHIQANNPEGGPGGGKLSASDKDRLWSKIGAMQGNA